MSLGKHFPRSIRFLLLLSCGVAGRTAAQGTVPVSSPPASPSHLQQAAVELHWVRAFSSAQDVRQPLHPVLDRALDIIAGPAEPTPRVNTLQLPSAVTTNSSQRIFVADPGARAVHLFDFRHSKYALLDGGGERVGVPVALAVDGRDNLYVSDESSRTVLVYSSAGKFQRQIGKLRGGESYFENPTGIAIDRTTGRIYVCDTRGQMVVVVDRRGHLLMRMGRRGGGNQPGDFRFPTQAVIAGDELYVLDAGNTRVQIFDPAGRFRRAIQLASADQNTGLAVDRDLNVYVSDPVLKLIQIFGREGRALYTLDVSTTQTGEFSRPSSLWVSADDCLYLVDSVRRQVSVFQITRNNARQCDHVFAPGGK